MKYIKKFSFVIIIAFVICMFIKPALCFCIIGVVAIYLGITTYIFLKNLKKSGITCTGKILYYQRGTRGSQTPVVEFTAITGECITKQPYIYASTDLNKIQNYKDQANQPVLILYDPYDPKKFVLASEKGFNAFGAFFIIFIGLAFIIVSICVLLGYLKIT